MGICSNCFREVEFKHIDVGIGTTEAWGVVQNHKDIRWLSPCCEVDEYRNTENFWIVDLRDGSIMPGSSQVSLDSWKPDFGVLNDSTVVVVCMTHEAAEKVALMVEQTNRKRNVSINLETKGY